MDVLCNNAYIWENIISYLDISVIVKIMSISKFTYELRQHAFILTLTDRIPASILLLFPNISYLNCCNNIDVTGQHMIHLEHITSLHCGKIGRAHV